MVSKAGSVFLRIFQLIFAACALGLSINAILWQYYGHVPTTNGYSAFAGAFGCLAGLIGLAAIWISPIAGWIMSFVDWLATTFLLAGGIVLAVGLRYVDCNNGKKADTWHNRLISGGCIFLEHNVQYQCGFYTASDVEYRCRLAEADTAFMFLGFIVSLIAAIVCVKVAREKNRDSSRA